MRVCVEGNIASGKTTALRVVRDARPDITVFEEPAREYADTLAEFCRDPASWSLPFSLRLLLSYRAAGQAEGDVLVERSCLGCRHVFSQLLYNEGKMSRDDWALFKEYADVLAWSPDAIVYVHTPADVCLARIRERGMPQLGEEHLDLEHLKRLEFQYKTMLRYADVPIVRVDGTLPPDALAQAVLAAFE